MIGKLLKSPEFKIIAFCIILRIFLFSLYGNKVSECPDSWAFKKLSEKISEQVQISYSNIFCEDKIIGADQNHTINVKNVNGKKKESSIGERSPGYPLLLFLCSSKYIIIIFQFLLGILTAIFWYKTLLKLRFSTNFSIITVLLLQTYLSFFIYETFILVETLVLFIISLLFYFISDEYLTKKKSLKFEVFIAFLLGYLVLVKPFYIILPCILLGLRFIKNLTFKINFDKKLLIVLFSFASYFGWSFVVEKYTGYFVSTTFFGLNKSQNCVYFAEKGLPEYQWIIDPYVKHREISIKENRDVAMSIWYAINEGEFKDKNLTFPELSDQLGKYAESTIKNNFKDYLNQVITKSWLDFWKSFDAKNVEKFDNKTADYFFTNLYLLQNYIMTFLKFLFLPISLCYFYFFLKKKEFSFGLITSVVIWSVSILQALVTYGENARFSFPFEYLMVFVILLFFKDHIQYKSIFEKQVNISEQ